MDGSAADVPGPGFYDILSVAFAERWDPDPNGTLAVRTTVREWGDHLVGGGSLRLFFTADRYHWSSVNETGRTFVLGDGATFAFDGCWVLAPSLYCVVAMTRLGVGPNSTLTQTWAVSYVGGQHSPRAMVDSAPGTYGYAEGYVWLLPEPYGKNYTIRGPPANATSSETGPPETGPRPDAATPGPALATVALALGLAFRRMWRAAYPSHPQLAGPGQTRPPPARWPARPPAETSRPTGRGLPRGCGG